jgi:hypothetical protein
MEDVLESEPQLSNNGLLRGLGKVCGEGLEEGILVVVDEVVQPAHLLLAEGQRTRCPGSKERALLGDNLLTCQSVIERERERGAHVGDVCHGRGFDGRCLVPEEGGHTRRGERLRCCCHCRGVDVKGVGAGKRRVFKKGFEL